MDTQKLAVSLRDSVALKGAELSIKLFDSTVKVTTESELISLLAHDVSFLSVVLQNLATTMLGAGIFNCEALEKIHHWSTQSLTIFDRLARNTASTETRVRRRFGSDNGGTELSEFEQNKSSLTPSQLTAFRADLSRIKTMLMLAYHLGNLATEAKANLLWDHRFRHGPMIDVLEQSCNQSTIDTVLALSVAMRSVLNPELRSKQGTQEPEDSNHIGNTDLSDEEFEIVDPPSTISESPIRVERENVPYPFRYRTSDARKSNLGHTDEEHVHSPEADSEGSHKVVRRSVNDRVEMPLLPDQGTSEASDQISHESQIGSPPAAPFSHEQFALQNYEMHLMPIDQQFKKRLLRARQESTPSMAQIPPGNRALQDYQMQLMLLEQQNKKRLLMAKQESTPSMAHVPPGNRALQDYQMQLMLLEQQNKKRLLLATQATDSSPVSGHGDSNLNHDSKPAPLTQAASEPPHWQIPDVQTSKAINRRTIEILDNHGLKPEELDPDTVLMLQRGTEQQLERFVQAWNGPKGTPQRPTPESAQHNDEPSPPPWRDFCNNAILTPVPSFSAQNPSLDQDLLISAYKRVEEQEAAANMKPNTEAIKAEESSEKFDQVQGTLLQPKEAVLNSQQQADILHRTLMKIKSEAGRQHGLQQRQKRAMQQVQKQQQQTYLKQREMATYRLQQQQLQYSQAEQQREEMLKQESLVKKQKEVHERIIAERVQESRELRERKEAERLTDLQKTGDEEIEGGLSAFYESECDGYMTVEFRKEQNQEREEKELVQKKKAELKVVEALLREYTTLYDSLD